MRRRMLSHILAGALALSLPAVALAQTGKDGEKKTADTWERLKNYTHAKKNEAVAYGSKLMEQTDAQIKQLQAKASKASGTTKAEYNRQIAGLKDKQAEAGSRLTAMRNATSASWEAAKQGFADAYRDLRETYHRLRESSDRAATHAR